VGCCAAALVGIAALRAYRTSSIASESICGYPPPKSPFATRRPWLAMAPGNALPVPTALALPCLLAIPFAGQTSPGPCWRERQRWQGDSGCLLVRHARRRGGCPKVLLVQTRRACAGARISPMTPPPPIPNPAVALPLAPPSTRDDRRQPAQAATTPPLVHCRGVPG
jgi:hypothetical protein